MSLFDGVQLLTPPRFARWRQQGKPLIFNPDFVGFVSFVALGVVRRRRSEKKLIDS